MNKLLEQLEIELSEWLTGFWEGDGSVGNANGTPEVCFYQRDIETLRYISSLVCSRGRFESRSDGAFVLLYWSKESRYLLRLFCKHLVHPGLGERLFALSRTFDWNLDVRLHSPTLPWVVGFWDAEGSSSVPDKGVQPVIYQKDIRVLGKIQGLIGGHLYIPTSGCPRLALSGSDARRFVRLCLIYSHNISKLNSLKVHLYLATKLSPTWAQEFEFHPTRLIDGAQ